MYSNDLIKIAPSYDAFTPSDSIASDVLSVSSPDIFTPDPVPSPGYFEMIPSAETTYYPAAPQEETPGKYEPMPVLMETPEVTAVATPDGGAVVEIKEPTTGDDKTKKILVLGGLALALYFLTK